MPASRSLIALLIGTVVFFALWMFALKGNSSSTGGSSKGGALGQYQSDISAARHAVSTSNASNAASGNENATGSSGGATASAGATSSTKPTSTTSSTSHATTTSTTHRSTLPKTVVVTKTAHQSAAATLSAVHAAVNSHKVVVLLFYNPAAADDQAVKQELGSVPSHKGVVVKLSVPLAEAASFTAVTQQVPLNFSPTLVLISTNDQASEIAGYADSFEIDQRVDDALTGS